MFAGLGPQDRALRTSIHDRAAREGHPNCIRLRKLAPGRCCCQAGISVTAVPITTVVRNQRPGNLQVSRPGGAKRPGPAPSQTRGLPECPVDRRSHGINPFRANACNSRPATERGPSWSSQPKKMAGENGWPLWKCALEMWLAPFTWAFARRICGPMHNHRIENPGMTCSSPPRTTAAGWPEFWSALEHSFAINYDKSHLNAAHSIRALVTS